MFTTSIIVMIATLVVIVAMLYLRKVAARAGIRQQREHWMVFGVFAGMIAVSGVTKENLWMSLLGLLLAVFGVVHHARSVIDGVKAK